MKDVMRKEYMAYGFWNCAGFHDLSDDYTPYMGIFYVRMNASPNLPQAAGWTWAQV